MKRVLIIGAGALGSAMADVLKKKRISVKLWDIDTKRMPHPEPLAKAIKDVDTLFLCIPSHAVRETVIRLLPLLKKNIILLSFAKGFEPGTGKTMNGVLEALLPRGQRFGIVGGPLLAAELRAGYPGIAVIASGQSSVRTASENLFRGTTVSAETSADMQSVALLGVIKNIYTIALGAVDGLGWGKNIKGKMLVSVLREMAIVLRLLGGKTSALYDFAGVGDLVATGYSSESRNYQFGYALGKDRISAAFCEGPASLVILEKLLGKKTKRLGLLRALSGSIRNPRAVSANLKRALSD